MSDIKVSVIIPVYGVEAYLPDCLDSVLGQSLKQIEVICIDDASPDNCGTILDDYAARDPRLRVIHLKENHRQGYGRNLGLQEAKGEYVYLLDSDDLITADCLEKLYAIAMEKQTDGLLFDMQTIFASEELKKKYSHFEMIRHEDYPDVMSGSDLLDLMVANDDWNVYVQKQFWKRSFLKDNGLKFPVNCEHEDEEFSLEAMLLAKSIFFVPEAFFVHRIRDDSVMTKKTQPRNFYGYFKVYDHLVRFVSERKLDTYAIDFTLGRIFDHIVRFKELLEKEYDLRAILDTEEEKHIYDLLTYSGRTNVFYNDFVRRIKDDLKPYRSLYIYGAGIIAKKICRGLMESGYAIAGVLVSEKKGNSDSLIGHQVFAIDELDHLNDDQIILICVSQGYRREIEELLDVKGFRHLYYKPDR